MTAPRPEPPEPARPPAPDDAPRDRDIDRPGDVRRPLMMDPAGNRPAGFAPPSARTEPATRPGGGSTAPAAPRPATPAVDRPIEPVDAAVPAVRPSANPWAPGTGVIAGRPARPHTPSVLAGPTAVPASPVTPAESSPPVESSFGPVSRVVTVSVRTPTSRVDLALPDRSTVAEVLETVLDVAPRSLREQALAHGGWILRTAAGRPLPGSTTLLDEGVGNGTTLFLAGADAADPAVVYDDVADAVADAVRADAAPWPATAGRGFALGAAGAFAGLAIVALLTLGPPWTTAALLLGVLTLVAMAGSALIARRGGDGGLALTLGLVAVAAGTAAATVGAAGSAPLGALGPIQWLVGAVVAAVLAGTAALATGVRRVSFGAIITAAGLLAVALAGGAAFNLTRTGIAGLVCGLAVCVMPLLPGLALRFAAFEPDPLPSARDGSSVRAPVDPAAVRAQTGRAVNLLTGFVHGLAWPTLAAAAVLALADEPAGHLLAGVVGVALLLRARLFRTVGQRLPLVLVGVGGLVVVPAGLLLQAPSMATVLAVAAASLAVAAIAGFVAVRPARRNPGLARAAEIADVALTIAVVPLVAAVVGAFAFVRGLGG